MKNIAAFVQVFYKCDIVGHITFTRRLLVRHVPPYGIPYSGILWRGWRDAPF
jgi:hypothetical protein